jgi:hypothetical protein
VPHRAALIPCAIAVAGALAGCNAIFGRDVHLADGGGVGSRPPVTPEPCAAPLPLCSQLSLPVVGDWDGNGTDTPGLFDNGRWCITNRQKAGDVCIEYMLGTREDTPVVGDWNGDGVDTPGWFHELRWYLTEAEPDGDPADFSWGGAGVDPLSGDWDGQGRDTPGSTLEVAGTTEWTMSNHNAAGGNDYQFRWGATDVVRLVGDWDGNGTQTPAWFRAGTWTFTNVNAGDGPTVEFHWGANGDIPLVGDWDGDGFDTVGRYDDGTWSLSNEHVDTLAGSSGPTAITSFDWGTRIPGIAR